MSSDFFEDNWCDVIEKARRGLGLTFFQLAERLECSLSEVERLFAGTLHKEKLATLGPLLKLNTRALLALTENRPPAACSLPSNMRQFTTLFHGMQVHSYLFWSKEKKEAIAFDTGANVEALLETLVLEGLRLRAVFLTHAHRDHIDKLSELCITTSAKAWIGKEDWVVGTKALPGKFSYQLDSSLRIEARATPGHSPGGTTYVIYGLARPVAIVGDSIFARSVGGISAAVYHQALRAIEQNILSLPSITILCPGHGPLTSVGEEKKKNPFFQLAN